MYATKPFGLVLVVAFLVSGGPASGQTTPGTAFTFQGMLEYPPGTPAGGPQGADFDFCFTLYDACTDGAQVGTPIYMEGEDAVTVTAGIFTVDLDFGGDVFVGDLRCLEVQVRAGARDEYVPLSPLQELRPTPYALTPVNPVFPVITGSGTENHVSKFDGPQSITDSNIYDDGNSVDIGVPVSTQALDVNGNIHASGTISSGSSITINGTTNTISATSGIIKFDDEDLQTTGNVAIGGEWSELSPPPEELTVNGDIALTHGDGAGRTFYVAVKDSGYVAPGDDLAIHAGNGGDGAPGDDLTIHAGNGGGGLVGPGDKADGGDLYLKGGDVFCDSCTAPFPAGGNVYIHGGKNGQIDTYADVILVHTGPSGDSRGKVGIGTTDPSSKLDVAGQIHASGTICSGSSITIDGTTDTISATSGTISFDDENLVTTGMVAIGPASPSEDVMLDVNGKAKIGNLPTGSGVGSVQADSTGNLLLLGSSKRYKTRIADLDTDPDAVLRLNPVRFQWKTTGGQDIGLIAEEVDEVIKDLVVYDQEGRPDAVKYDRLSLYLLAVLRELKAENDAVKERLEALERKALRQQPVR